MLGGRGRCGKGGQDRTTFVRQVVRPAHFFKWWAHFQLENAARAKKAKGQQGRLFDAMRRKKKPCARANFFFVVFCLLSRCRAAIFLAPGHVTANRGVHCQASTGFPESDTDIGLEFGLADRWSALEDGTGIWSQAAAVHARTTHAPLAKSPLTFSPAPS